MRYLLTLLLVASLAGCGPSYQHWQADELPAVEIKDQSTTIHVVLKDESLQVIAWLHDLDYRDIARWNNIHPPYLIYPDQELQLVEPKENQSSDKQPEKPMATATNDWLWPTRGKLVCRFTQGICKKGIYIKGEFEQEVFAAHAGTVVYSGTGIKDYGGLIILQHAAGYFSAYAHNARLLVKENERISVGQKIAVMGMTRENYPALYFEVRLNGKSLNPLKLLPSTI